MIPKETLLCNYEGIIGANETLPKIYWIKKNEPEIFEKTRMIFPCCQDYIIFKLTGVSATSFAAAANTTMMVPDRSDWSDEILSYIGLTRDQMPELHKKTDIIGEVGEDLASECGLAAGTKLVIGTGDTESSMVGAGLIKPGDFYMNGGTSAGILGLVEKEDGSIGYCGDLTASSGTSYKWLKEEICRIEQEEEKTSKYSREINEHKLIIVRICKLYYGKYGRTNTKYRNSKQRDKTDSGSLLTTYKQQQDKYH